MAKEELGPQVPFNNLLAVNTACLMDGYQSVE